MAALKAQGLAATLLLLCALVAAPGPAPAVSGAAGPAGPGGDAWRALVVELFPGVTRVGPLTGAPPAAELHRDDELVGFAFRTGDMARIPAYSGAPVDTLVVIDRRGTIRGARVIEHAEPILVVGVQESDLTRFTDQYQNKQATRPIRIGGQPGPDRQVIDGITGATITVMVINASVARAARLIVESRLTDAEPAGTARGPDARAGAENVAGNPAAGREPATGAPTAARAPPSVDLPWREAWERRRGDLIGLGVGLAVLSLILLFQDWLARFPTALQRVRLVFLVYTVVFIGWYALAQLSVLNVFTFLRAFLGDFAWETFLIDPMAFALWSFVAMTLLLWGRGVYCGWLCPFGAMQELASKLGQRLGVPQLQIPELFHERLLAIKYLLFIGLFGLTLYSAADAVRLAEVEPFKTAVILRFDRPWPFVAYAVALLLIATVNGKFFCKYLCPLGAALAVPARLRIFDWLRRRPECAHPCQSCAKSCPSQAIRPTGEINVNECHYCLDCQMTYWNAYRCPPLVERRKRAERRSVKVAPPVRGGEATSA